MGCEKALTLGDSEMAEGRKQLTDKEIQNFIDDLDNSITSSSDSGK